jgi:hypothetical protein
MSLPILPFSPLPADLQRTRNWGENVNYYDSGASQGDTAFMRPLFVWDVPIQLMNELKEGPLVTFVDTVKGMTLPFLMKDAYEYQITSGQAVSSGITSGATGWLIANNGFFVRVDTTTIGSLFSASSGYVTLGSEYSYEQDTGIITVNTKASADVWGLRNAEYFRKVRFSSQYSDTAKIWNIWTADLQITELP